MCSTGDRVILKLREHFLRQALEGIPRSLGCYLQQASLSPTLSPLTKQLHAQKHACSQQCWEKVAGSPGAFAGLTGVALLQKAPTGEGWVCTLRGARSSWLDQHLLYPRNFGVSKGLGSVGGRKYCEQQRQGLKRHFQQF